MNDLQFLQKNAVEVARELIGWSFYRKDVNGLVGGMIIETEAYTQTDEASHSYRGESARNSVMFDQAGQLYVYFTYGMHYCLNIVTGPKGVGEAVLIRSLIPDKGLTIIRRRRNNRSDKELTNGPAKICQALGISLAENGQSIDQSQFLLLPPTKIDFTILEATRIGIKKDIGRKWRFILAM